MKSPMIHHGLTECLNTKEAAAFLGFSEAWLRKLRCAGKGPKYVKFKQTKNSKVLYHKKDLEEFNRSNWTEISSTAEWNAPEKWRGV